MRLLFKIMALSLIAIWLPATQHCALAAAGVFPKTCDHDCAKGESGTQDGCGTVEDGAYKPSLDWVKVPAPALFATVGHLWAVLPQVGPPCATVISPRESFDRPRDWVSTWQFARRAAPPARAPTVLCA
jgi:hypothetical protein